MKEIKKYELSGELRDFFDSVDYRDPSFKPVAWGFVLRGDELLIAERYKKDDPKRKGQLVIPGGGIKEGENYITTAQREVIEETGIDTVPSRDPIKLWKLIEKYTGGPNYVMREGEKTIFTLNPWDDSVWIAYKDTGKKYRCFLVKLDPKNPKQKPSENSESDARNPRYESMEWIKDSIGLFTPACQIGIGLGLEGLGIYRFFREEDLVIEV